MVLQVLEHYDEGEQALAKVKNEIMDKLYSGRMEPAMREYLKDPARAELRGDQARFSGHRRRRRLRDSGSKRDAGSQQAEEGP